MTLVAEPLSVGVAGGAVREVALSFGFPSRTTTQLRLAVEEAVSNVVLHAYPEQKTGLVEVRVESEGSGLKVHVRDWGKPLYEFQTDSIHGLHRMQSLTSKLELHNLGQGGKEVVLHLQPPPASPRPQVEVHEVVEETLTVRAMQDSDATHVCECFYSGYGYSYAHADLYYPERLLRMVKSGRLKPVVAVTSTERVVGFSALVLEDPEDDWGELAMAIVHPSFRGHHLFDRMFGYLVEVAREQKLEALFAHAVSVHPISQHVLHKLGMSDTAILLGFAPPTEVSLAVDRQRQTFVIEAMRLGEESPAPTFYAGRHQDMVAYVLEPLGYRPTFSDQGETSEERSVTNSSLSEGLNIGTINFRSVGRDAKSVLASTLRRICLQHVDVVQLYVPLNDPGLVELLPAAELLGFFFAGVHPGWAGGDALVLQYLNNLEIDPSTILLERPQTQHLLNYVLKCQEETLRPF